MVEYDDFVKTVNIKSYTHLMNILRGNAPNFREKFIFRGLGNVNHKLIPSALRKDKNGDYVINDYIDSKFSLFVPKLALNYFKEGNITQDEFNDFGDGLITYPLDKFENRIYEDVEKSALVYSDKQFHFKRELYVLLKFLNLVDRTGLKINVNSKIRELIHENLKYNLDDEEKWPNEDFFEIISLAQHYGVPTEALDWSYDYNVSLYFAVRNILEDDDTDCILWAFNYNLIEKNIFPNFSFPYKLHFYRPEYFTNPNLRAQKGLFTFIVNKEYDIDERPFDEIIVNDFINNIRNLGADEEYVDVFGLGMFKIPDDEKLFYKFVIPGNLKLEILKELYIEGYSEDYLFPGYWGVVLGIQNKVKFDIQINKLNHSPKQNILMNFEKNEINNIRWNKKYVFRKRNLKKNIDKIFIYSQESKQVFGYFNTKKIIHNPIEFLWDSFHNDSTLNECDFNDYFKNDCDGFAIKINNLVLFDYPINIYKLNLKSDFIFISPFDKNLNFLLNF